MSDSRADKIDANPYLEFDGVEYIYACESAGLLVVDPEDPAVIDRVARVVRESTFHSFYADAIARAVLAALGGIEKSTSDYDGEDLYRELPNNGNGESAAEHYRRGKETGQIR